MNTDSNIASRVVSAMIQEGESVLIYHDSFICRESAEEKLLRSCTITLAPQMNAAATMLQVLSTTDANEKFRLGRAVVASLLNASRPGLPGTDYPVTTQTIIAMFNATFDGGTYPVNSTTSWDRALVIWYLESLYSL